MKRKLLLAALGLMVASSVFALKGQIANDHNHLESSSSLSGHDRLSHHNGIDQCGGHTHGLPAGDAYHYHMTPQC